MTTTKEYPQLLEIDAGNQVKKIIFTTNGEHLVGTGNQGVQVWRVKDGKRVATMPVKYGADKVAVSRNGRYIAAGQSIGKYVFAWNTTTYEQVLQIDVGTSIYNMDFSPDSTRLVSTDAENNTATIWDFISAPKQMQTLEHREVIAAKYSPQGDRIATASYESIRVWDSKDGHLLVDVREGLVSFDCLLWRDNHLFIATQDRKIKQIDASTGSTVFEWRIPHADSSSFIAMPQHAKFIAHSVEKIITFLDLSGKTQPGPIQHTDDIRSIAFSSDGQLLAIAANNKITVRDLSSAVYHPISDPEFDIDSAVLDAWEQGQLTDAETFLSAAIPTSQNTAHHVLASRALVRSRLGDWDAALVDAKQSIEIRRSLLGYAAKSVALVGKGKKDEGIRVCDIAFEHFHSEYVSLLLLIKAIILFMAGDHVDAISRMNDLINDSAHASVDPTLYGIQAYMYLLLGNKHIESKDYDRAIRSFEDARIKLGGRTCQPPLIVSLISGWGFGHLVITIHQCLCEALLAGDRAKEAGECVMRMLDEKINMTEAIMTWVSDFRYRCRSKLEDLGDNAMNAKQYGDAISLYTIALSLNLTTPQALLVKRSNAWVGNGTQEGALNDAKEWARSMLAAESWGQALSAATGFMLERSTIYRVVCEHLETDGRVPDAVACLHQVSSELAREVDEERVNWVHDFKSRCRAKLECLGDNATNAKQYDKAISQYTAALSLESTRPHDLLVKRSKAYAGQGNWNDALNDADEIIKLDPSSPLGYERKYAALLGVGHHDNAIDAFETMLSKMSQSSDPDIRERSRHHVRPEQTKKVIRAAIQDAIRDSPLVLIDTLSGCLCNKSQQTAVFESTPAFATLVVSMTTHIDRALIGQVVREFYRYATFSHTWEGDEPLYETVIKTVVYNLAAFPTHNKLQMFCKIAQDEGFNWAWSDTCCINKGDQFVLQEALVSMFKWYEGSALTIIFLCDVDRLAEIGALMMSLWNSRGWTLQEYHASKVVRIYTKDWTPYLGLTIYNHKESPEIISEMEKATGISAASLKALRPGLNDIREKLRLASTRRTTRVEDAAYSLLGIFSMTLPATYGEGDKALGRLLSQLLTSSGDTSILAWTGKSGSFNSCLPAEIVVFSRSLTSHIPPAIPEAEMATIANGLNASPLDHNLVAMLYDQLNALPLPSFLVQRMKLPCLAFKIGTVTLLRKGSVAVFRAQTRGLGAVEIKTRQNIAGADSLYLVHPWIDFLLDRRAARNIVDLAPQEDDTLERARSSSLNPFPDFPSTLGDAMFPPSIMDARVEFLARLTKPFGSLFHAPTRQNVPDYRMEFLARLTKPFGALLLAPTRRNVPEYRRISTENVITAQVQEFTSETLNSLIEGVRVLDVL